MELSERLLAVAGLVTEGCRLADIGTDHGYIPIYLTEQGKIPCALAMDINEGPLARARENIAAHGLSDRIKTRRSDGLQSLEVNETESMIAAGMGGALVIKILKDGKQIADSLKECILQPQSEVGKVRRFLVENGFFIDKENMVYEDGKYYPMLHVIPGRQEEEPYKEEEYEYGRRLLEMRHPVLKSFLEQEIRQKEGILSRLSEMQKKQERTRNREAELKEELSLLYRAYRIFSEE